MVVVMRVVCLLLAVLSFVGVFAGQQPTFKSTYPSHLNIPRRSHSVPATPIIITGRHFKNGLIVEFNGDWYPLTVMSDTVAYWMFPQRAYPESVGTYQMSLKNTHGAPSNSLGFQFEQSGDCNK